MLSLHKIYPTTPRLGGARFYCGLTLALTLSAILWAGIIIAVVMW